MYILYHIFVYSIYVLLFLFFHLHRRVKVQETDKVVEKIQNISSVM